MMYNMTAGNFPQLLKHMIGVVYGKPEDVLMKKNIANMVLKIKFLSNNTKSHVFVQYVRFVLKNGWEDKLIDQQDVLKSLKNKQVNM